MINLICFGITGGLLALLGILSASTGLASSFMQRSAVKDANEKNLQMQDSINRTNIELAKMQNLTAIAEAQKDRDFQEHLSNTYVQRRVADLQASGLNPLMAVSSIGNGSSPAGSLPSISSARVEAAKFAPESLDLAPVSSALQSIATISLINALGKKADTHLANKKANAKLMKGMEIL